MAAWQIQHAKARLSEVIERARNEGPQTITRHGAERAVVLSIENYRALIAQRPDFNEYLLGGPKVNEFFIERDRDTGRLIDFQNSRPVNLLDTNVICEAGKIRANPAMTGLSYTPLRRSLRLDAIGLCGRQVAVGDL